ncbi:MAG: fasciclin domain-containing protein [Candidatus Velthaea sp.]|jgi:uncharacterized surface protein with fasciclin (FAS1) repeats
MNKTISAVVAALALTALGAAPAFAQSAMSSAMSMKDPMVGGAPMSPAKNIVQNAVNSKDHTTLVALVKKAGLVETLEGPGPFTVFAPTNEAFAKIPKATLEAVGNDPTTLKSILTYHVVAGKWDSRAIADAIKAGGGKATLKTVDGEPLVADMEDGRLVLTDAKGGKATVTIPDVYQSNGVIHVVNSVLMP